MDVLGGVIALIALGLLLLGVVVVIRPIRQLGFEERWHGLVALVGGVVLVMAAQEVSPTIKRAASAQFGAPPTSGVNGICDTDPATGSYECRSNPPPR
jgi:uncharacterized membrane protein YraQ (UPF0718 family)